MSTLKADTLVASDGTSPVTLTKQSAAKVWTLDETLADNSNLTEGTFNVSSTVDVQTGYLEIVFTNSFSANDYSGVGNNAGYSGNDIISCRHGNSTASRDEIRQYDGAYKDGSISYVAFGDLA